MDILIGETKNESEIESSIFCFIISFTNIDILFVCLFKLIVNYSEDVAPIELMSEVSIQITI
jgi:hypothetical protein